MKKLIILCLLSISILVIAACGDEKVDEGKTYNHNYSQFELDVDYTPTEQYEASFEKSVEGLEASINDEVNKEKFEGDDAFDKLNPLLEKLTFDATTPNDEVINQVISTFGLDENFAEFDLEVLFSDGSMKEYKLIK